MKTNAEIEDLITRYVILLKFTSSTQKIEDLLTDFMLRIGELQSSKKEPVLPEVTDDMIENEAANYASNYDFGVSYRIASRAYVSGAKAMRDGKIKSQKDSSKQPE
jgi:hypothetical protein